MRSAILLIAPLAALAAPARLPGKRAASDILVFKFAKVLEDFEASFYKTALQKFKASDFTAAGFQDPDLAIEQITEIGASEATHATVLEGALKSFGEESIQGCQFNFDAALTDVATMAAVARVVENTGVAAYLGGAPLLTDPVLLDAAGSILTVEARHSSLLNILSGTGTSVPAAFDIPMTPSEVLAIAGPFISGCDVGIPANPSLAITNTGSVGPGTLLQFKADTLSGSTDGLFCQMTLGGASTSIALPLAACNVPDNINGPVMIHITNDSQPLVNNVRDRATNKVVAGPTLAFIDTKPQKLSQLSRTSSGSSSGDNTGNNSSSNSSSTDTSTASDGETTSTQTISPQEASSIIAGATASANDNAGSPIQTASGTDSAAGAAPTVNAAAAVSSKPNLQTGPSADGKITVDGWTGGI